eukprot:GHRQ01030738.1.p2 GENE.GHRQ01030738.1~~GHRQ01030738.1.p2  ORF type:complete len:120 (+),score=21.07 GHRQ01030738.1:470-829(+)
MCQHSVHLAVGAAHHAWLCVQTIKWITCPAGEVPGLFALDEKEQIISDVREWVEATGGNASKDGCYSAFINRVRDNLHIVLTMSPVGDAFRARCAPRTGCEASCRLDSAEHLVNQAASA